MPGKAMERLMKLVRQRSTRHLLRRRSRKTTHFGPGSALRLSTTCLIPSPSPSPKANYQSSPHTEQQVEGDRQAQLGSQENVPMVMTTTTTTTESTSAPSHTTDTGVLSASTKTVDHCFASPLEATHHSIPVVATLSHQPTTPINGDNPASQDSQASPEPSESPIRLFFCVGRSIQNGERGDDPEALSVWTVTRRHAIPPGQRSEALKKQLRHANKRVVAEVSVFSRDEMGYASGRLVEKRQLLTLYASQMDWEDFLMESMANGWKNIIGDRMEAWLADAASTIDYDFYARWHCLDSTIAYSGHGGDYYDILSSPPGSF
ncbi:hypothetical protein HDK90DRAFT_513905 [Phyllosticta capitalensis]|uniref:Uncharacterized protein n=1 Tax=Phyllosticta capitalensis TaxID=121624 RepID=A0ABR1YFQ0_9PEZI